MRSVNLLNMSLCLLISPACVRWSIWKHSPCGQCGTATRSALSLWCLLVIETLDETSLGLVFRLFRKTNFFQEPLQMIFPFPSYFSFSSFKRDREREREREKFSLPHLCFLPTLHLTVSKLYFMWNEESNRVEAGIKKMSVIPNHGKGYPEY